MRHLLMVPDETSASAIIALELEAAEFATFRNSLADPRGSPQADASVTAADQGARLNV